MVNAVSGGEWLMWYQRVVNVVSGGEWLMWYQG